MPRPRSETSALFPGVGPVTEQRLLAVDIKGLETLRQLGAVRAYQRLKFRYGKAVTLNALYGLEAVILGYHWLAIPEERKAELREAVKP